ncbi:MAG: RDD family protein, partial [Burkholderiales bacterium]|nr:RDD family protein [Burkholderiales bacterium]
MSTPAEGAGVLETPGLGRRLACFVYEGLLLFGVVMVAGLVYGVAIGQRDPQVGHSGLQALLFAVIGAYFIWFWSRSGQTLAMKTWRIR